MKKLKKTFGWLTVLLAILGIGCIVAGPIIACVKAEALDQIAPTLLEIFMPGQKIGGEVLFNFEVLFAFEDVLVSVLGILGIASLALVAINLIAWIVLAIVMKRPGQILIAILFTIVVAIPAYLAAMQTVGIVEMFEGVIGIVSAGAIDATVMLGDILPLAGLLICYLALLFAFATFVFNVLFLIFNRKVVMIRREREKRELYSRHKEFIKGFKDRVAEAERSFDELKEFVATDKGHALYLRPELKDASKNLKEARKALKKAEAKYKSEKNANRKPKSAKELAYEKKINEKDARRAKAAKEAELRRAKALEERKAKEDAAKRARAKAEKEAAERRAAELEARKAREAKERKLVEARRAEALKEREAREAAAKRARAKAAKEAAERRNKVLEERKVREEIAKKQAELRRARALEERKVREEIAKKQAEIRRAKALEERKVREEAAKKARAKALKEREDRKQQEAELRAAIKKVEEEFRGKHSVEVKTAPAKVAPVKKAPAKKAHKKATKKVVVAAPVVAKAPVKKPVAKKAPAKKTPVKKPVAKKAPIEKAPAKKPVAKKVVAPVANAKVAAPAVKMTFAKRIAGADKALKDAYNEIKSEIMSYGVNSRVASAGDTFRLHTKTYVKMVVAGKSLKLYMALNPKDYANSPMPIGDASKKNLYKEIPLVFKVKSVLSLRRAKMLIADTMAKDKLVQGPVEKRDWIKEL